MTILDASPDGAELPGFAAGDVDNDGQQEMLVGSDTQLTWYRPSTNESGVIGKGHIACGVVVDDIDGDGQNEVACGLKEDGVEKIVWFKKTGDEWKRYDVDTACTGHAHDLLCVDIDGDGEKELVANAAYCPVWGVFVYKKGADVTQPWQKATVQTGVSEEGL